MWVVIMGEPTGKGINGHQLQRSWVFKKACSEINFKIYATIWILLVWTCDTLYNHYNNRHRYWSLQKEQKTKD